jgi:hypothetical protein
MTYAQLLLQAVDLGLHSLQIVRSEAFVAWIVLLAWRF